MDEGFSFHYSRKSLVLWYSVQPEDVTSLIAKPVTGKISYPVLSDFFVLISKWKMLKKGLFLQVSSTQNFTFDSLSPMVVSLATFPRRH